MVTDLTMPKSLSFTLKLMDGGMIIYWAIMATACMGLIILPRDIMYAGYGSTIMDVWNWSFVPLDLAFSILGLASVRLAQKGDARWLPMALLSLALTFCAGLMAVSFWMLTGYFDISWWLPNLLLMSVAMWWLPRLILRQK